MGRDQRLLKVKESCFDKLKNLLKDYNTYGDIPSPLKDSGFVKLIIRNPNCMSLVLALSRRR